MKVLFQTKKVTVLQGKNWGKEVVKEEAFQKSNIKDVELSEWCREGQGQRHWLNKKTQVAKEKTDWHLKLAGKNLFWWNNPTEK